MIEDHNIEECVMSCLSRYIRVDKDKSGAISADELQQALSNGRRSRRLHVAAKMM